MLKLKFVGILLTLSFLTNQASATAQYPDKIFYNEKEYNLNSNPMEDYFKKFPEKKPQTELTSSALWRGYIAKFEIIDNGLYLIDITVMSNKDFDMKFDGFRWKSFLSDIVPTGKKLKIDWFAGILILPFGKEVEYVHMGYQTTYENYILLEIDKGNFKKSKEFTLEEYEKFKGRQFDAFKKTEDYKKLFEELKKRGSNYTDEFINSYLKDSVIGHSSKFLVD